MQESCMYILRERENIAHKGKVQMFQTKDTPTKELQTETTTRTTNNDYLEGILKGETTSASQRPNSSLRLNLIDELR
jgi:hypothetical protein